jgi:hypothetical protein
MNSFEELDPQQAAKAPVNKEAFKMLSMEVGLNEAARKLGIPIPTAKSWARRGKWKLPKRTGGRPGRGLTASQLDANRTPIADALAQTHKEREAATRSQLEQAAHNWALAAAQAQPQVPTAAAFAAVIAGIAKLFGWDRPGATFTINSDKTVIVCDEGRRAELIVQRQRLLEAEKPAIGRTVEAAAPVAIPAPEMQSAANVGTENSTGAQDPSPVAQPDAAFQHMQSIGRADTWKTGKGSEPEAYSGSFGPWPEEEEFR